MKSYPVKENPIGSAVSEILRYKQTDRQTNKQTNKQKDKQTDRPTNRQTNKQTDIVLLCIIYSNLDIRNTNVNCLRRFGE